MPQKLDMEDGMAELLRLALQLENFYPAISADYAAKLFPQSGLFYYESGEYVIKQGDTERDIFIVQTGSVHVTQTMGSAAAELAVLEAGSFFGEVALLSDGRRRANVIVREPARIYRLIYGDIYRVMKANPPVGQHLLELAKERTGQK
jgi:CRP-like cAMP-binding protein